MQIQISANRSLAFVPHSRFITFQIKRCFGLSAFALILTFAGTAQAVPFGVGLAIENDMDSNGNITVVNGSKVTIAYWIDDPDKVSNAADKIQLLRVDDDSIVSSVARGKNKSGTVSSVVKHSEDEALYVGYIRKGNAEEGFAVISHPFDPNHIPLLSIPKASLADLTIRLNAVMSAPPPLPAFPPHDYIRMFEKGVAPSALPECTDWNAFRRRLMPPHYTCVQFLGSAGEGITSCDSAAVTELATAVRDGVTTSVNIDGTDWRTYQEFDVILSAGGSAPGDCTGPVTIRPCMNNEN